MDIAFEGMWEKSLKLDDPAILLQHLNQSGLDGHHILDRCQDTDIKHILTRHTLEASQRGGFSVPLFFVNYEMFSGEYRMAEIEETIIRFQKIHQ